MDRPGTDEDEPAAFLELVKRDDLVGQKDIYEISIVGITEEEDQTCAEKGGQVGGANNLWVQGEFLCEDFLYSAWRNCKSLSWICNRGQDGSGSMADLTDAGINDGRGGSVDATCLRFKIDTVW